MQPGQIILSFQDSKGPLHTYAAEILQVEENKARIAIYGPEEFRVLEVEEIDGVLVAGRDTSLRIIQPKPHELKSVARMKEKVIARLTESEKKLLEPPVVKKPRKLKEEKPPRVAKERKAKESKPKKATKKKTPAKTMTPRKRGTL